MCARLSGRTIGLLHAETCSADTLTRGKWLTHASLRTLPDRKMKCKLHFSNIGPFEPGSAPFLRLPQGQRMYRAGEIGAVGRPRAALPGLALFAAPAFLEPIG